MAHSFVVLRKTLLNVQMYTSSHFAWTPRIALICIGPIKSITSLFLVLFARIQT